jgi:D-3-phosphoglycerate dehydrogenase
MRKILLTNKYSGTPLKIIKDNIPDGFELVMLENISEDSLEKQISSADYLLVSGRIKITNEILTIATNLKMIQRTGVGLDSLDLEAIRKKQLPLYVNQGVNSQSVAEHTLLLMLASLRRLPVIDANTKNGVWKKQEQGTTTHELSGKTVGIIGMGNIGQRVAKLVSAFGAKILYSNIKRMPEEFEKSYNMRFVGREELFKASDIITLHCALTDETRGMINAEAIASMKDGVIIVNTARGPVVDADALAESLISGKVAFAALDVHEKEPIPEKYPLKGIKNVILTPHVAGITYESFNGMMHDAMRNIEHFENGDLEGISQYRYL